MAHLTTVQLTMLLVTLGCLPAFAVELQPAAATLCSGDEMVVFSCSLGPDLVSLCALRRSDVIKTLTYRAGQPGRFTDTYVASTDNGRHFKGTVGALSPQALVRQVWFEREGLKVLLSECVGGDCPQQAAQAVWRGDRLLSARRCQRTADDRAWFSHELVRFGADVAGSRSASALLRMEDIDNGIEAVYPMSRTPSR